MTSTQWFEKVEKIRDNWLGKIYTVASLEKFIKNDYIGKMVYVLKNSDVCFQREVRKLAGCSIHSN